MANIRDIKSRAREADIPLRELGSRSGVVYSRVCDALRGWVTLREPELQALQQAVNAAVRARAEKFNRILKSLVAVVPVSREHTSADFTKREKVSK